MSQSASESSPKGSPLTKPAGATLPMPLRHMRSLAIVTTTCLVALLAGCAATPETKRSLAAYTQTMDVIKQ